MLVGVQTTGMRCEKAATGLAQPLFVPRAPWPGPAPPRGGAVAGYGRGSREGGGRPECVRRRNGSDSMPADDRCRDAAKSLRIPAITVNLHSLAVPWTWTGSPGCISPKARTAVVRIVRADRPASHRAPVGPLNDCSTASSPTRVSTPWSPWSPRQRRRLFPVFVLHRHRLRRGRGCQQDPGDTAHEALRHALADRRRTGYSELPRPYQIRQLRAGMEDLDRRHRHTSQRQHQSTCSSDGNLCLNSMNQAAAITALRDPHPA